MGLTPTEASSSLTWEWLCLTLEELGHELLAWTTPGLFIAGEVTIDGLLRVSNDCDAAVFLFSEDDKVWYRTDTLGQPRDLFRTTDRHDVQHDQ